MAKRRVSQTGKDADGDITKLCNPGDAWSPRLRADAIKDIEARTHEYYTLVGSREAQVYVKSRAGRKFLTTSPDGYGPNNLDNLPDC